MDNFIIGSGIIFLVPFFTTIGVAAPLKTDPILSGTSIRSFRHLELKNPSIISDFDTDPGWCNNSRFVACKNSGAGGAAAGAGVHLACRI